MSSAVDAEQPLGPTGQVLRIYLLSPPWVESAGRPLDVPRREARALLYRLAANLQPVARDHLCSLFWPDAGASAARRNLSYLLTHLRDALALGMKVHGRRLAGGRPRLPRRVPRGVLKLA